MKVKFLCLILIIWNFNISISQEIYFYGRFYGFGIADYSNCGIVRKLPIVLKSWGGATIDIFKFPDGRLYRAYEWGGGFVKDSIPFLFEPIKKHHYSDISRVNERAVSVSVNSKSIIYIVMRAWDNSKSYLMEYDYTNGRFTILGNVGVGLRKILCIGNKLLGIEEELFPYRYYKFIQMDPYQPEKARLLFTIDSSLWVKDYNPQITSPIFSLFKAYESYDHLNLMLSCYTIHDSITKFYKIDFRNQKLIESCRMDRTLDDMRNNEGYKGYDFLRECDFEFDYDLDNSTDTFRNCRVNYKCPKSEQKIHDEDWNYFSDGSLDSLQIELLTGDYDSTQEYLIASHLPAGAYIEGNHTRRILIRSNGTVSGNEIRKILDGIHYKNNLTHPTSGERLIRTLVFIPWFEDTAYTKLIVPQFPDVISDTSIWLCPEAGIYDLSELHFHKSPNGFWQQSNLRDGLIYSNTPAGKYNFLYSRGNQCNPDTAILDLNYHYNPHIDLGDNLVSEGNVVKELYLEGDLNKIKSITWWLNNQLIRENQSDFEFEFVGDTIVRLMVQTEEDCIFRDSVMYFLSIDDQDVWVPDAFSPNGDQINDVFFIKGRYDIQVYSFEIFDRWGNKHFRQGDFFANDENKGWDGRVGNLRLPSGVYIYQLVYAGTKGRKRLRSGVVNLIR